MKPSFEPTPAQAKALSLLAEYDGLQLLFGGGAGCGKTTLGRAAIWQWDGPVGLIVSNQRQAHEAREVFNSIPEVHITTVDRAETLWAYDLSLLVIDELDRWDLAHFENTRRCLRAGRMQLLVTASPIVVAPGKPDPIWWIRGPEHDGAGPVRLGIWSPWLWPEHVADAKPGDILEIDGVPTTYVHASVHATETRSVISRKRCGPRISPEIGIDRCRGYWVGYQT